jgi:AraC family transcriptional regulator, regulatory protein of adaptative response / DNA-3-methyladenine glycosylase II
VPRRTLLLPTMEPFDGDSLLAFLAARAIAGVEEVMDGTYRRTVALERGGGVISVTAGPAGVRLELDLDDLADADDAVTRWRRLFDLDTDPAPIVATLGKDTLLGPLVNARPGLRVPGAADGLELAVRAIVGQQVSVAGARTVLGRLVAEHGEPLGRPATRTPDAGLAERTLAWRVRLTHHFPTAAALAEANPAAFPFPRTRADALISVARLVAGGELRLDPDTDPDETRARLVAIPGIGPWTASYIAMRALGDRDIFLPGDVGVRHALSRLGGDPDPERWRPWRSYAVMHLWRSLAGEHAVRASTRSPG